MRKEWSVEDLEQVSREQMTDNPYGYYNPKNFWEELGKRYIYTFADKDPDKMTDNLLLNMPGLIGRMNALSPLENILEVGCGFGRVLGFVWVNRGTIKYKRLVGLEFSSTMVEKSHDYFRDSLVIMDKPDSPQVIQGDACCMPFKDKEFDLVYTHVCLTHIPPDKVVKAWEEINRVAKRYIILIERYRYDYEHNTPHVWSHNHAKYFMTHHKREWDIINYQEINEEHGTKILTLERK
jgi:SAM-dependent methyltransferase